MEYELPKEYIKLLKYIVTGHGIRKDFSNCLVGDSITVKFSNEDGRIQTWRLLSDTKPANNTFKGFKKLFSKVTEE